MLIVTGVLLLLTRLRRAPSGELTAWRSLAIGVAQTFAMIPGISRSGATICAAIYLDVKPEKAANFSFLMLLPVVIGATLLKAAEVIEQGVADWVPLVLGTVVAFASGIVAIRVVLGFVRRGRLQVFAWYCFAVGTLGLLLIP
jgi:undecaprenyl-diphosphatase